MQDIILTPHFRLKEFTNSATAMRHGIVNEPSTEAVKELRKLCIGTLEPLRVALGQPVIITSGYRCKALNDLIAHLSRKSQHMKGQAADFYIPEVSGNLSHRERLILAFRTILTNPEVDFDQLILYPNFIHVSFVSCDKNRHSIMTANGQGTYRAVTREVALSIQ